MTVTAVHKDLDTLTLRIISEFAATPERIWQLWADPRQLERWWGPPVWPATFTTHELTPGGRVAYHMTGPDGNEAHGWWRVGEVDAPRRLTFTDGFADPDGTPSTDLPTTEATVVIEAIGTGRTRMAIESVFPSLEAMQRVLDMGMEEGMTLALGQIEAILEGVPA
jgi:uncharacterized protein YndB with AHSA1/START domain